MKRIYIILLSQLFLIACCRYDKLAWEIADGYPQLVIFLNHYKELNDKKKYLAACYIVENMQDEYFYDSTGKCIRDIDVVIADSLIMSLDFSFELLKNSPYLSNVTFDDFCKYILPYRVANEPITYYWKWDCYNRLLDFNPSYDVVVDSDVINKRIHINVHPDNYSMPLKSYNELLDCGYGSCDDRAIFSVMMLRSIGIMSAMEYIPFWGSANNGHSFATVIGSNGEVIPLPNSDERGKKFLLERKTPKIFRKSFDGIGYIDVTSLYGIGYRDIDVNSNATVLSVFSPKGWVPVAIGNYGHFTNIGTGINESRQDIKEAEDLGDGIVYLPMIMCDNSEYYLPCGNPVIVSQEGVKEIKVNHSKQESITLSRKYPLNTRVKHFAENMLYGVFEAANNPDFSDAEIIYTIKNIPESNMQYINIDSGKSYQYVRYKRPLSTFSIAELCMYDSDGNIINFTPICDASINKDDMMKVFDNDPLSYFEVDGALSLWIGVDFGKKNVINKIAFAPRNDDNSIYPGHLYELFYWDGEWISLGMKISNSNCINFDKVPTGALLWLRDLTKGKEERLFTISLGRQIWW